MRGEVNKLEIREFSRQFNLIQRLQRVVDESNYNMRHFTTLYAEPGSLHVFKRPSSEPFISSILRANLRVKTLFGSHAPDPDDFNEMLSDLEVLREGRHHMESQGINPFSYSNLLSKWFPTEFPLAELRGYSSPESRGVPVYFEYFVRPLLDPSEVFDALVSSTTVNVRRYTQSLQTNSEQSISVSPDIIV